MNKVHVASWGLAAFCAAGLSGCATHPAKKTVAAVPAAAAAPAAKPAVAASQPASAPAASAAASQGTLALRTSWAVVQSIDAGGRKLIVKDKRGKVHTFMIAADAAITKGGNEQKLALADLKEGDYLKLRVAGDEARSVHVNVKSAN